MKLTEDIIYYLTQNTYAEYLSKEYPELRIQVIIRMVDKLHNRCELEIRKINKAWTNFKSEFYKYDNMKQLEQILRSIK